MVTNGTGGIPAGRIGEVTDMIRKKHLLENVYMHTSLISQKKNTRFSTIASLGMSLCIIKDYPYRSHGQKCMQIEAKMDQQIEGWGTHR